MRSASLEIGNSSQPVLTGSLFVGGAAVLWATDALFRLPIVGAMGAVWIVFFEHLIGAVTLTPWALTRKWKEIFGFKGWEWFAAILLGAGASALATVLFTASFRYLNPSIAILLQKLQPIIVVVAAFFFLDERPPARFYFWALVAIVAAGFLGFPQLEFGHRLDLRSRGVLYALLASLFWAMATIGGKALLKHHQPMTVTFWRYVFGLVTLLGIVFVAGSSFPSAALRTPAIARSLIYMSLIPGVAAMLAYYKGLLRTPASVATIVELLFPVSAVILNYFVLGARLSPIELGAGAALVIAATRASL